MPTHFPQAVPEIPVRSVEQAAKYYVSTLGFSFDWGNDADGIGGISQGDCRMFLTNAPFRAAHGTQTDRAVLLLRAVGADVEGWSECVAMNEPFYTSEYVEYVCQAYNDLFIEPVEDKPWNLREFRVADPDGNQLRVFYDFNWEVRKEDRR